MDTNYKNTDWVRKLTMEDGIENPYWDEIAAKVKKCYEYATELRAMLKELADDMDRANCTIKDEDGDYEGIDSYTIQDYASIVSNIENNLSYEI